MKTKPKGAHRRIRRGASLLGDVTEQKGLETIPQKSNHIEALERMAPSIPALSHLFRCKGKVNMPMYAPFQTSGAVLKEVESFHLGPS